MQMTNRCLKISPSEVVENRDSGESSGCCVLKNVVDESVSGGISEKRKWPFNDVVGDATIDQMYACQNAECPQSEPSMGFTNKNSRTTHESLCAYRIEGTHLPFHDYISNDDDAQIVSVDDWMEMARANMNNIHDVGDHIVAGGEFEYDVDLGHWLNGIEHLELQAALEMVKANVDLTQSTPAQILMGQEEEATSIWDLAYQPEQDIEE